MPISGPGDRGRRVEAQGHKFLTALRDLVNPGERGLDPLQVFSGSAALFLRLATALLLLLVRFELLDVHLLRFGEHDVTRVLQAPDV